ncbi:hypothetical protein Tco_0716369 [Tanacetum coccineum]
MDVGDVGDDDDGDSSRDDANDKDEDEDEERRRGAHRLFMLKRGDSGIRDVGSGLGDSWVDTGRGQLVPEITPYDRKRGNSRAPELA